MTAPIHIRARSEDVAPIVLLPGDPGRATRAAERLECARCYNEFRGLLGYTGSYKGTPVSVQSTGMGAPSAAIVVEELALLGVKTVVRIGTCGGAQPEIRPTDLIIATGAYPLDGTTRQYLGDDPDTPEATDRVVRALVKAAERLGATPPRGLGGDAGRPIERDPSDQHPLDLGVYEQALSGALLESKHRQLPSNMIRGDQPLAAFLSYVKS